MADSFLPALVCAVALLLDRLFGEPRVHPLVWFGNCAAMLEQKLNNRQSRVRGLVALLLLTIVPVGMAWAIQSSLANQWFRASFDVLVLAFVIGWQSMKEHARAVSKSLQAGDLETAREKLSLIVSRDTGDMDERLLAGSTIESVLEKPTDPERLKARARDFSLAKAVAAYARLVDAGS